MPRYARQLSSSGIYHIMLRGNERKVIFQDDEDKARFLDTIERMKENGEYNMLGYCLMDNHVHLLIKEGKDNLQRSMKRVCVSYAYYFNKKYNRVGHLFQDRYRSENIEVDAYLLACARYIHKNPVKAGMVKNAGDYKWSSYNQYTNCDKNSMLKLCTTLLLDIFSKDNKRAIELFEEYTKEFEDEAFIDYHYGEKADEHAAVIESILESFKLTLNELSTIKDKKLRNTVIRQIKDIQGVSIRGLSKRLGISKDVIFRA